MEKKHAFPPSRIIHLNYVHICPECFIFVKTDGRQVNRQKEILKNELVDKLIRNKIFWSYSDVKSSDISDEILIEKVLIYLDIEEIESLFHIYPYEMIKRTWQKEILIQDPFYHSLNLLLAYLYFNIRRPETYIKKFSNSHRLSLQ